MPLRAVSAVLDGDGFHPGRTARAHLRWVAAACGMPAARADDLLEMVGLADAARTRVGAFSLGMRQRLAVAAALIPDSPNLILDEPVNGLDVDGIIWMRALFRHLAGEGHAVVISSHLLGEVSRVADRVVILGGGRVIADGPPSALSAEHGDLEAAYVAVTRAAVKYGRAA